MVPFSAWLPAFWEPSSAKKFQIISLCFQSLYNYNSLWKGPDYNQLHLQVQSYQLLGVSNPGTVKGSIFVEFLWKGLHMQLSPRYSVSIHLSLSADQNNVDNANRLL